MYVTEGRRREKGGALGYGSLQKLRTNKKRRVLHNIHFQVVCPNIKCKCFEERERCSSEISILSDIRTYINMDKDMHTTYEYTYWRMDGRTNCAIEVASLRKCMQIWSANSPIEKCKILTSEMVPYLYFVPYTCSKASTDFFMTLIWSSWSLA